MEDCELEACPDNVGSSRQSGGHSEVLSLKKQKQKPSILFCLEKHLLSNSCWFPTLEPFALVSRVTFYFYKMQVVNILPSSLYFSIC